MRASWGPRFDRYTHHNVARHAAPARGRARAPDMRFVYASSSSVYGDALDAAHARGRHAAPALALRRDQARRRAPVRALRRGARRRHRRAALLHRLRPAPAPRHGLPPLLRGDRRPASRSRSSATAARRATSPTWPTSSPPRAPPARPTPPPGRVFNIGGGEPRQRATARWRCWRGSPGARSTSATASASRATCADTGADTDARPRGARLRTPARRSRTGSPPSWTGCGSAPSPLPRVRSLTAS